MAKKFAIKCIASNFGTLIRRPEWTDFIKENPDLLHEIHLRILRKWIMGTTWSQQHQDFTVFFLKLFLSNCRRKNQKQYNLTKFLPSTVLCQILECWSDAQSGRILSRKIWIYCMKSTFGFWVKWITDINTVPVVQRFYDILLLEISFCQIERGKNKAKKNKCVMFWITSAVSC